MFNAFICQQVEKNFFVIIKMRLMHTLTITYINYGAHKDMPITIYSQQKTDGKEEAIFVIQAATRTFFFKFIF